MDYFENLVKTLFEEEFCWVAQSVKVNLTKEEKKKTGKHTIPRPEIDLLVFDLAKNRIILMEVKSYLDSNGVGYEQLIKEYETTQGTYKLFTCENYRNIVFRRLRNDLIQRGHINNDTTLTLGLAAGNVHKNEDEKIRTFFKRKGWLFWSPSDIKERVQKLAEMGYENNPYVMTAKVLQKE